MADTDGASSAWTPEVRSRVKALRAKAEARWVDPDASVSEVRGLWRIRSLNEKKHPAAYWEGPSLEAAEDFLRSF